MGRQWNIHEVTHPLLGIAPFRGVVTVGIICFSRLILSFVSTCKWLCLTMKVLYLGFGIDSKMPRDTWRTGDKVNFDYNRWNRWSYAWSLSALKWTRIASGLLSAPSILTHIEREIELRKTSSATVTSLTPNEKNCRQAAHDFLLLCTQSTLLIALQFCSIVCKYSRMLEVDRYFL